MLKGSDLKSLLKKVDDNRRMINEHHIEKECKFENFRQALHLTNKVGELAQNHDIHLTRGKVKLTIWAHKVGGLTKSDFILAAKSDQLF
ncbi:MAG: 4a-hydroxytetrahydrobiopterin dehydratase [Nitrospinota bacterium]|nr:4a-hydroxytetrahydrobiopterin dehydratase [Nitrospinota bacterium]